MDDEFKGLLVGAGLGAGIGLLLGFGVGLMLADNRVEAQIAQLQRPPQHSHPFLVSDGGRGVGAPGLPGPTPPPDPGPVPGPDPKPEPEPRPTMPQREHIIIQRENFTTSETFVFNEPGVSMPIEGPGVLEDAIVITDSDNFNATVTLDGEHIYNASFTTLKQRSPDLSRLAAYHRAEDGKYVFYVGGYEYQQSVEIVIEPKESITFDLQRAEVDIIRGH